VSQNNDNSPVRIDTQDSFPFPKEVAVLGTNEPIVFPHMIAPVVITTDAEKQLIDEVLRTNRLVGMFPLVEQEEGENGSDAPEAKFFQVGTLCAVLRMLKITDETVRLLVHGIARI